MFTGLISKIEVTTSEVNVVKYIAFSNMLFNGYLLTFCDQIMNYNID